METLDPNISLGELGIKESKQSLRVEIWKKMHKEKVAPRYPRPFGKIPDFRGSQKAAEKLLELPEFQSAKCVEVNPDVALEAVRALVLSNNKELYVPTPRLRGGFLKKLEKVNRYSVRTIVTSWGMYNLGKPVGLEESLKIDLIIVGCVAVSRDGYRIGKGKGFADLEFAILKEIEAIDDNTPIVAVVHDIQVFETLDNTLFKIYDVPVNYIVTPTEIIKTKLDLPKPTGVYWSLLTIERVNEITPLQKLKIQQENKGQSIVLKVDDKKLENNSVNSEVNSSNHKYKSSYNRNRNDSKNTPTPNLTPTEIEDNPEESVKIENNVTQDKLLAPIEQMKNENVNQNKRFHSRRYYSHKTNVRKSEQLNSRASTSSDLKDTTSSDLKDTTTQMRKNSKGENIENVPPKVKKPKKKQNGYSLIVSNIQREVKVRHLKNALIEKGIRPNFITWLGFRGFCLLHYAKKIKTDQNGEKVPLAIDNVIELIKDLNINPNPSQKLTVKVKEPITRIETLDVTSV